jgi:cytochrome c oxidase subunit IV
MTTEDQHTETEGHAESAAHERPHPGPGEYIKIAVILAIVTAIEVGAYYVKGLSDGILSVSLLVMMVVKFALVGLWFMHLRFDNRLFRRLFVTGIVLALAVYTVAMVTLGLLV